MPSFSSLKVLQANILAMLICIGTTMPLYSVGIRSVHMQATDAIPSATVVLNTILNN